MILIERQPNKKIYKFIQSLKDLKKHKQKREESKEERLYISSKRIQKQMEKSIEQLKNISNEEEGWRFIRKNRKKRRIQVFQYRLFTNTIKISVLAICSTFIFFIFSSKSNIEAWKVPLSNISVQWNDNKLEIKVVQEKTNTSLKETEEKELYILDLTKYGYKKVNEMLTKRHNYIEYENDKGNKLTWVQWSLKTPMYTKAILEEYLKKEIDGVVYHYIENEKDNTVIWTDNRYQYQLSGSESINTLIKMTSIENKLIE